MLSKEYLADSQRLIHLSSSYIKETMTPTDAIQGALLFALGVEKLLKHLLADINPIFILKVADFKHSAPSLYADRIVSLGKHDDIVSMPDSEVITFRVSLRRSKIFSHAANKHGQLLYTLAHWRDVIAHRPTTELDFAKVKLLLTRDAISLVGSFAEELKISLSGFFGQEEARLTSLSQTLSDREKFKGNMLELLEAHERKWNQMKIDPDYVSQAHEQTASLLQQSGPDFSHEEVKCPACGNDCVVRIEPDYDYADGESYVAGVYADYLRCYYCGLRLESYDELDFVEVNGLLASGYDDDL